MSTLMQEISKRAESTFEGRKPGPEGMKAWFDHYVKTMREFESDLYEMELYSSAAFVGRERESIEAMILVWKNNALEEPKKLERLYEKWPDMMPPEDWLNAKLEAEEKAAAFATKRVGKMRHSLEHITYDNGDEVYRLVVYEKIDGVEQIYDVAEGDLRQVYTRSMKMFEPDSNLGIRKVK